MRVMKWARQTHDAGSCLEEKCTEGAQRYVVAGNATVTGAGTTREGELAVVTTAVGPGSLVFCDEGCTLQWTASASSDLVLLSDDGKRRSLLTQVIASITVMLGVFGLLVRATNGAVL